MLEHGPVGAVERPAVRLHETVHEALVQAVHGLHQGLPIVLGVTAEGHPRALAGDDLLYDHGHDAAPGVEPQLPPVQQGRV